jgi:hypothetical protein
MYRVHNNASTSVLFTEYFHVTTSKRMRWQGHVKRVGGSRNANRIFVEKPDRKYPLLRLKHIRKDHMQIDLQERKWSTYWIYLAQDMDM